MLSTRLFARPIIAGALVAGSMYLVACGDDNNSASAGQGSSKANLTVVTAQKDLDSCSATLEGEMAYVTSTGELLFCLEKEWKVYGVGEIPVYDSSNGKDGTGGTSGTDGKDGKDGADGTNGTDGKDGVDGKDGSDGTNGSDGKDGADGVNGVDGTSCTGKYVADSTGIEISCGGKLVGTIWNGADGVAGSDGGTTANIEFNTAAAVEIGDTVWSYSDSLLIRISDNDIASKKDTVKVSVTSTSDSKGFVLDAIQKSGYYYATLRFTQNASKSPYIKVADGGNIVVSYKDENPEKTICRNVAFVLASKQSVNYVAMDKAWYYGDSAEVLITVNDKDATEDSLELSLLLCHPDGYECHYKDNDGGYGSFNKVIKIGGAGGFYQGKLVIVNEGEKNHDNYIFSSPEYMMQIDVSVTFKNNVNDRSRATAYWKKTSVSGVEFDADRYTQVSKGHFYVFDGANTVDSVMVTLVSVGKKDTTQAVAYRNGEYYYGEFLMDVVANDDALLIKEQDSIFVYYTDPSGVTVLDVAKASFAYYATLTFGDTLYMDTTDRAVLKLTDNTLTINDVVTVNVKSESDFGGVDVDMYTIPGGDGTERIGYVEFSRNSELTNVENFEKKLYVKAYGSETITAEYGSNRMGSTTRWFNSYTKWGDIKGNLVDDRDGQMYKLNDFGGYVWMVENLNYNVKGSRFFRGDSATYCKYGRLYHWTMAMDTTISDCGYGSSCTFEFRKGICPMGTHLPTGKEIDALIAYAKTLSTKPASVLKTEDGWESYSSVAKGTNSTGFNGYPIGYLESGSTSSYNSEYSNRGYGTRAYYWGIGEFNSERGQVLLLSYESNEVEKLSYYKTYMLPVRCVLDYEMEPEE